MTWDHRCPICESVNERAFSALVLDTYEAEYRKCTVCGFLGAPSPSWLDEAYRSAIAEVDTGVLARARHLEARLTCLLGLAFPCSSVFADVGAGYGVLVRTMRDVGFDFRWSDPWCENLLARGFELGNEVCAAITAIEVLEHAEDPRAFLREALGRTGASAVVFTTELLPVAVPDPASWWYYAFSTGQHIAFFERRTLVLLADRLGLRLLSRGNLHVMHTGQVKTWHFKVAATRLARAGAFVVRRSMASRTDTDNPLLRPPPQER